MSITLLCTSRVLCQQTWDKLATQCRRKDMTTRVSLMQQLFTARLRDAKSVDKHISNMNDTRAQLANVPHVATGNSTVQ